VSCSGEKGERRRAEELWTFLELRQQIQLAFRYRPRALGVGPSSPRAPAPPTRLTPVQHQDRVKRGRVQRRRDTSADCHLRDLGVILDRDVRMQRNSHEYRRVCQHPRDVDPVSEAIAVVVAAVVDEQWITAGEPRRVLEGTRGLVNPSTESAQAQVRRARKSVWESGRADIGFRGAITTHVSSEVRAPSFIIGGSQ
jgi:hypothetical protein